MKEEKTTDFPLNFYIVTFGVSGEKKRQFLRDLNCLAPFSQIQTYILAEAEKKTFVQTDCATHTPCAHHVMVTILVFQNMKLNSGDVVVVPNQLFSYVNAEHVLTLYTRYATKFTRVIHT